MMLFVLVSTVLIGWLLAAAVTAIAVGGAFAAGRRRTPALSSSVVVEIHPASMPEAIAA